MTQSSLYFSATPPAALVLDQEAISVLDAQIHKRFLLTVSAFATQLATTSIHSEQLLPTTALQDAQFALTQLDNSLRAATIVTIPPECASTLRPITALRHFSMVSLTNSLIATEHVDKTVPRDTTRLNR